MGFWSKAQYLIPGYGPAKGLYDIGKGIYNSEKDANAKNEEQRQLLNQQTQAASDFANQGQAGFTQTGAEAAAARGYLRDIAEGKNSLSGEQLRQGLQQNLSATQAAAQSAPTRDRSMAARTALTQGNLARIGTSGQAALAGIAERQKAQQDLNAAILGARGQELTAATQSRATALGGLKDREKELGAVGKYGDMFGSLLATGAKAFSDRRLKTDIKDADDDSRKAIEGLKAYSFNYRNQEHGKGRQVGVMAQDLEKAGLGHAVIDTPEGKAVHGAKLATSNTAMIAALGRRVKELEGKRRKDRDE